MAALPHITYAVIATDDRGEAYVMDRPLGMSREACVTYLVGAHIERWWTLLRIERQDRAAGTITDVTAEILTEVTATTEAWGWGFAPDNQLAAFEAYRVAPPVEAEPADDMAEHRIGPFEAGVATRRVAA